MLILVTYDVSTETAAGRKRLRRVAKACESYGHRVQKSVFECQLDKSSWAKLKARLEDEINLKEDSLRYYYLGENGFTRVEHHGQKPSWDMKDPLIL